MPSIHFHFLPHPCRTTEASWQEQEKKERKATSISKLFSHFYLLFSLSYALSFVAVLCWCFRRSSDSPEWWCAQTQHRYVFVCACMCVCVSVCVGVCVQKPNGGSYKGTNFLISDKGQPSPCALLIFKHRFIYLLGIDFQTRHLLDWHRGNEVRMRWKTTRIRQKAMCLAVGCWLNAVR